MSRTQSIVLLTRPQRASEAFLLALSARAGYPIPAVVSPVFRIVDEGPLPSLNDIETVILSSRHAVERLGRAGLLQNANVATVGASVAEAALGFGAKATCLGKDVEAFLGQSERIAGPCIHCRGLHSRGDLAERLTRRGIKTREVIVYNQVAQDLTTEAQIVLASERRVVAPVFSPRSAALLSAQVSEQENVHVVAISKAAAVPWSDRTTVSVAASPDRDGMVSAVLKAI